jgi:energy-coupling factor transporter ATP-binding protein EcfA2
MTRIDRLVIENYRGASNRLQLDFEKSKQIALIFGENGTGKTTIADALDAIGNCSKGSLEDKSSTRARDHLPTIGKKPTDVRIELTSGGNTWNTSLTGDSLSTNPSTRPKIRVMRRVHLQRLIEAPPAQRYEALRHFIDVDKVERSENALRDATSDVKSDLNAEVKRRTEAEAQLQKVWEAEGKPGNNSLAWAEEVSSQETAKLDEEAKRIRIAQQAIIKAESVLSEFQGSSAAALERDTEAQKVEQEITSLPGIETQQAMSLTGILKQVDQYLQVGTHPNECPVCKQGISLDKLRTDVKDRLAMLKQYADLRTKRETATHQVQIARQAVEPKRKTLLSAAQELLIIVEKGEIDVLKTLNIKLTDYPEFTKKESFNAVEATAEAEKLVNIFSGIKPALINEETSITKKAGLINSIRIQYEQVKESKTKTEELSKLAAVLQKSYDLARLVRINFTQGILDEVAAECNRLYALVHPNEPIAISKLALDQGKRASLNQAATFEGHNDVPPQAYFSESHLDTLGFCFWLAIAKRESTKGDVIIVLDDVFTSVDTQHLNRVSQLITDESKYFAHVIVNTHLRLLRDIYRYQHGAGKYTEMIELQRWSLAKGISNYKTRLAIDELIVSISLTPFDRQITASKAGVLLEAILDHLALQYRCRVARTHDGNYTLGELLDGTENLFKKLEIHRPDYDSSGLAYNPPKYAASTVTTITNQLRSLSFLRNQVGAHFNVNGSAISDADVQLFADLTVNLAVALSCPTCGQIPGKKMTTHYQCSCMMPKEIRMLPIQL